MKRIFPAIILAFIVGCAVYAQSTGGRVGKFERFNPSQFMQSQDVVSIGPGAAFTNLVLVTPAITFTNGPIFTNAVDTNQFVYDTQLHVKSGAKTTNQNLTTPTIDTATITTANVATLNVTGTANLPSGTIITNLEARGSGGSQTTQVGLNANASGSLSSAFGNSSTAGASSSLALGVSASATNGTDVALGKSAKTTAANQIRIGTSSEDVSVPGTITLASAGTSKLRIREQSGSGAMGVATLVAGAKGVSTIVASTNSRVFLTIQTAGGTLGSVYVNGITNGSGFGILSTSSLDTSTVAWLIIDAN